MEEKEAGGHMAFSFPLDRSASVFHFDEVIAKDCFNDSTFFLFLFSEPLY